MQRGPNLASSESGSRRQLFKPGPFRFQTKLRVRGGASAGSGECPRSRRPGALAGRAPSLVSAMCCRRLAIRQRLPPLCQRRRQGKPRVTTEGRSRARCIQHPPCQGSPKSASGSDRYIGRWRCAADPHIPPGSRADRWDPFGMPPPVTRIGSMLGELHHAETARGRLRSVRLTEGRQR